MNVLPEPICVKAKRDPAKRVPLDCLFNCPYTPSCMEKHRMASTNAMLKQLSGMLDTKDLNDWEHDFVTSVWERSQHGDRPDLLTPKQVEHVEKIHSKHFAN